MFSKLKKSQSGFTLIEVIVANAILSIALLGATVAFITLSRLHSNSLTIQQIQQESRNIVETISRDIRSGSSIVVSSNKLTLTSSVTQDRIEYYLEANIIKRVFCENLSGSVTCSAPAEMNTDILDVTSFEFEQARNGSSGAPFVALHFVFEYNGNLDNLDPKFQQYELNSVVTVRTINGNG